MNKIIPIIISVGSLLVVSCNNNTSHVDEHGSMNHMDTVHMQQQSVADSDIKTVTINFSIVDPAVSSFMNSMAKDYLSVKNALINSDESLASGAAEKMNLAMKTFDKSLLTTEQKKVYDDIAEDLKEHAEHIAKSKIEHQRLHFSMMSDDMYDMVKAFGAGMTLYHERCPMYNDNKGAMWLSESKVIRNPYYGDKMMTCGNVIEMFK